MHDWLHLVDDGQLDMAIAQSYNSLVFIFKHSTRCGISSMVLNRFNRNELPHAAVLYLLDILKYRDISNRIARELHVHHESPQLLVLRNGDCILDYSHNEINASSVLEDLN